MSFILACYLMQTVRQCRLAAFDGFVLNCVQQLLHDLALQFFSAAMISNVLFDVSYRFVFLQASAAICGGLGRSDFDFEGASAGKGPPGVQRLL